MLRKPTRDQFEINPGKLRAYMKLKGYNQQELAKAASTSPNGVNRWLNGRRITFAVLQRVCKALEVHPRDLLETPEASWLAMIKNQIEEVRLKAESAETLAEHTMLVREAAELGARIGYHETVEDQEEPSEEENELIAGIQEGYQIIDGESQGASADDVD